MALKLTAKDIHGVASMPPTPSTDDGGSWRATNSVDHNRSASLANKLVNSGVGLLALCGTTGECAALLWEEKRDYISTMVKTVKGRIPIFAGVTALGTKETIRQIKGMKDVGAEGVFVGLPLWQTPTMENATDFYKDMAEAEPDVPIMVYSNRSFFKTNFPLEFWEGIGKKGHTVVTNKIAYGMDHIEQDMKVAPQVNFVPGSLGSIDMQKRTGRVTALWTTSPWPEPWVALINAIVKHDEVGMKEIEADLRSIAGHSTPAIREKYDFAKYNAQVERWNWNASGYQECGPNRPPYTDFVDEWKNHITNPDRLKKWAEVRAKYLKVKA